MILDGISGRRQLELMENANRTLIERYFNELFNQGKVELLAELLHPDYVNHSPGTPELPRGRDGVGMVVAGLRRAFPDLRYSIDDLVIAADAVATRTTMTGTHRGDLFGLPATGRSVQVAQFTVEHIKDGKIIAHHRLTDDLSLLRQLGVLPAG
jgi:steroid delta-isomerase-like uncharacterized protein